MYGEHYGQIEMRESMGESAAGFSQGMPVINTRLHRVG